MKRLILALTLAAMPLAAAPPPVAIADLAGDWMIAPYIEALAKTRAPLEAEKVAPPDAFSIGRDGTRWKLDVTDFHEGSWRIIDALRATGGDGYDLVAGAYEELPGKSTKLTHFKITIARDAAGKIASIRGSFWDKENAVYVRLPEPRGAFIRRTLLAGHYRDAHGDAWTFRPDGTMVFPTGDRATYDPTLDTSEACCNYFTTAEPQREEVRIGYRFFGGKLLLYRVIEDPQKCPLSCADKPYAVLTRQ